MQLVHSLASIDNYGHAAGGSKWTLLAELKLPALGFGGFCLQVAGGVGNRGNQREGYAWGSYPPSRMARSSLAHACGGECHR